MAYKGVLPSDLWDRYDCEGGNERMLLDIGVATDMQQRISEATENAKKDGKSMVARRNQRRAKRELLSDTQGLSFLKEMGVPIVSRD